MVSKVMLSKIIWTKLLNVRCCQCANYSINSKQKSSKFFITNHYSTEAENNENVDSSVEYVENVDDVDEGQEDIEHLRDISRLPRKLRNRMQNVMIPPQSDLDREGDRWKFYPRSRFTKYQKTLFAKYGYDSGVNPAICWPSKEELAVIVEDEKTCEPTLQEMWAKAKSERDEAEKIEKEREDQMVANMAKMPSLLSAYRKKLHMRGQEEIKAAEKQAKLLEDMRDHFGYQINEFDPRYKEFKAKRSEEERIAKKLKSRDAREAKNEAKAAWAKKKLQAQLGSQDTKPDTEDGEDEAEENEEKDMAS